MEQVLLLEKWEMEVDDAGMKQANAEDWKAEMSKVEGWSGGSGLESWQAGKHIVVQEYWREKKQLIIQPNRKTFQNKAKNISRSRRTGELYN